MTRPPSDKSPAIPSPWNLLIPCGVAIVLVGIMTYLLSHVQDFMSDMAGRVLRPYGIAFLLIIAGMAVWRGLYVGLATTLISLLAAVSFLVGRDSKNSAGLPEFLELLLLGVVGVMIVVVIHNAQQQRQQAEDARREAEAVQAQLQTLMDTAPVAMLTCDAEGILRFANKEAERIWGQPLLQIPKEEWGHYNILTPDGERTPPDRMGLARALKSAGALVENESIIERPDGRRFWITSRSKAVIRTGSNGKSEVLGGISVFLDVTHQREIEAERDRLLRALLLSRPDQAPGLELATYYAAAQTEMRVGGDFYDVFSRDNEHTVIVVGDMSGKGVPAAAQVAMVRNMLRFALYRGQNLAESLNELNETLATRHLLSGFTTLFVGVYSPQGQSLDYASCGHEPALLRRAATGQVEELPPTGPVLGAFDTARFTEREIVLHPGDALVAYTDGISEAGRSRRDYLGIERLAQILHRSEGDASAEHLLHGIIAGVDRHAPGPLHDDRCLLVARFAPPG